MLSLRIFDEIEVATIATDKTTILEIRRSHSTSMKFDNVSLSMTAKKSAKKCTACSKFCFAYKFCLLSLSWLLNLAKQILDVRPFRLKTADLMKNARQNDYRRYPLQAQRSFFKDLYPKKHSNKQLLAS